MKITAGIKWRPAGDMIGGDASESIGVIGKELALTKEPIVVVIDVNGANRFDDNAREALVGVLEKNAKKILSVVIVDAKRPFEALLRLALRSLMDRGIRVFFEESRPSSAPGQIADNEDEIEVLYG